MQTFKKLLFLLTLKERKQASLLLLMVLMMALIDMIGVASILPFMAVLTNPELIETNSILNEMFQTSKIFNVESKQQFIFFLGIIVFLLLVVSLIFKAFTTYAQLRFIQMQDYSISKRLVEGYLRQPYSWFLNRHSAELGKTILGEVSGIIGSGIKPLIEVIAKGTVIITIIVLLIIADPKLAIIVGSVLGLAYGIIFYFIRSYLKQLGKKRLENNRLRFITISEVFGAFKEVKVGGLEETYVTRFSNFAKIYARTNAASQVIAQIPRFILEAVAFGGILLLILYMMAQSGSFSNALPIVSLYVFAGYRLMPAVQQMYTSFTQLTFVGPSLNKLYDDLKSLKEFDMNFNKEKLSFHKKISLNNIYYNYPNASRSALKSISFSITAKTTIGLMGATGSGKTTIIDIILGLLEAQKGTLEVDGKVITSQNLKSWQRSIGYVPQHIFLSDDTIEANIAFGTEHNDIDKDAVKRASKIANLHNFVKEELPKQYQTTIGERGIRLSGGQRQRIGIARALYHNPSILIFDEATSALDTQTEKAVMDAVNNLNKNITIILIAHRLNTLKNCDIIFKLEKGQIIGQGNFNEIVNANKI